MSNVTRVQPSTAHSALFPGDPDLVHRVPLQLEPISHDGWDARLVRFAAACVTSGLLEWAIGKVLLEKSRPFVSMVTLGLDLANDFHLAGGKYGTTAFNIT